MKAINMCTKAKDFALALAILESCIKPVLFTNAWHDNLGKALLILNVFDCVHEFDLGIILFLR